MSLRIVYAAGPGDVLGTYRYWKEGRDDPAEVAVTYSGQFYDLCRELDARAWVISSGRRPCALREGRFKITHRPIDFHNRRGILYHLGQVWYGLRLTTYAIAFRANVIVVATGTHWFVLTLVGMLGVKVIPLQHGALWPHGNRPRQRTQRLIQDLNGWFWRRVAAATVCVSPECERQIREIATQLRGPVYQGRAHYRRGYFDSIREPSSHDVSPFRVMFAGRIERSKGVFDLVSIAARLQDVSPGRFAWTICGSGSAEDELRREVERSGLGATFEFRGQLDREGMAEEYGRSHAIVVTTPGDCVEGLNKVAVEGVLAGRPVVASRASNALDVLTGAICEVPADDVEAYATTILRLCQDRQFYEQKRQACLDVQTQFYDEDTSWKAALRRALLEISTNASKTPSCQGLE